MDELVESDALLAEAGQVRDDVAAALASLGVGGELVLTGGASLPGALTRGDVDLHLPVAHADFAATVTTLARTYPPASPTAWAPTLAVFDVPGARPTGLAVTPRGSEHDRRFRLAWQALAREPRLLAEYNALKSAAVGTAEYEDAKSRFFTSITRGP